MAQPIEFHTSPHTNGTRELLQTAPAAHGEAILSALELLQQLHEKGVLSLLRGVLGAGDQLVAMTSRAVDTPEVIRAIRNFILLTQFFASIHPDVLNGLVESITAAAEREKTSDAPSMFDLLRRLRNEENRRAAAFSLDLLSGIGKALR